MKTSSTSEHSLPRKTKQRELVVLLFVCFFVITSAAIAHVWTHLRAIEYGYKISLATQKNSQLMELNRRLRMEIALLKNPQRVSLIAKEQLGLSPPDPDQIQRLPRIQTLWGDDQCSKDKIIPNPKPSTVVEISSSKHFGKNIQTPPSATY